MKKYRDNIIKIPLSRYRRLYSTADETITRGQLTVYFAINADPLYVND